MNWSCSTSRSPCNVKFVKFASFFLLFFSHRLNKIVLGDRFLWMHCKSIKLISRLYGVINSYRYKKLHYVLKPRDARIIHVDKFEFLFCGSYTKMQLILWTFWNKWRPCWIFLNVLFLQLSFVISKYYRFSWLTFNRTNKLILQIYEKHHKDSFSLTKLRWRPLSTLGGERACAPVLFITAWSRNVRIFRCFL